MNKRIKKLKHQNRAKETVDHRTSEVHKLIVSEPNNSHHWLKLAALSFDNQSLEEARKVFERAFQVVNFSSYGERDNLWKALMNLEFHFGDSDSFKETVSKAANSRVASEMIGHAMSLYTVNKRFEEGEWLMALLLRKGERKEDSWLRVVEYLLDWTATEGNDSKKQLRERIRETNKRALQSLDKRDHVAYLNRYAVLEYKKGSVAEGRTQFENLVTAFPRRADLWTVYLDMESKYGTETDHLRSLFEKATQLSLRPNAMKLIFKKFLLFEKQNGTQNSEKKVKRAAAEYVSKLANK